ncbi:beta strand repeat-containing protein [Thioalkalivibrio sp. HK1]|uniref:beta strand repeat-containing protein n=1 Tax=Thioalkalivibrio sp. HK1 TaxID=1469245 RepID=UPI0012DCC00E|nr:hypothetical protein [Thioalkalivibrio sp. HK1]
MGNNPKRCATNPIINVVSGGNLTYQITKFPTRSCLEWADAARQRASGYDSCSIFNLTCGSKTDGVDFIIPPRLPTEDLEFSDSTISVGEGQSVGFDVRLGGKPSSDVTVTITSASGSSANITYDKTSLTFTTSNYSTWQTITVTAPADDDTQDETDTLTFSVTGGIVEFERSLQVTANDYPAGTINVTPSDLSLVEGGASGSFNVSLSRAPSTSQTTVSIVSGDPGALRVSPSSLVFDLLNHSTAQTVTVTTVQDSDYANESVDITFSISAGGLVAPDTTKSVSVTDNDGPPGNITVSPSGTLAIDEGDTGTFTVALDTQPARAVTVSLTSGDTGAVSVSPASLTFTPANYGTARTVTVTGVQDSDYAHENAAITLSATDGIDAPDATKRISVTDDDTPPGNFTLTPSTVDLFEGNTGTFTVMFDTAPNQPVTVSISSGDTGAVTISPASMNFDASNYDTEQIVTITSVQDSDNDNESVDITLSASGGIAAPDATVTASIDDDDAPSGALTVTPSTLDIDEGDTGTFTVALDTEPSNPTVVSITGNDNGAVTISPTSLNFDSSNYDTAKTVTITAVQDSDYGDEKITIVLSVSGGLSANDTMTINIDDDDIPPGNLVMTPSDPLILDEGGTGIFGVFLDTAPTTDITVSVVSSDTGAVTVSPSSLTFGDRNHSMVQTLTVTAVQDGDHANEVVNIALSISTVGGITASDLTKQIIVNDDDIPSGRIALVPPGGHTLDEGSLDTFTVALDSAPSGDVTVDLRSGDAGAAGVSPTSLTFNTSNYDTAQTVTITAVDDDDTHDESIDITLTVSGKFDAPLETKSVIVDDDDWGIVVISSQALDVVEGGSGDFEVALDNRPSGQTSIALSSDHPGVTLSPSTLAFSDTNWNSPQTVSITAAEDDDTNYENATITLDAPADPLVPSVTISVLVSDNDATDPGTTGKTPYDYEEGVIEVFPTGPVVIAQGGAGGFSVRLSSPPTESVSVRISKNPFDITLSPSSLIFTADNYDSPRFITVTADRNNDPYDTLYTITFSAGGTPTITRKIIVGGAAGRVRTQALALPPSDSKDSATLRVRCNQDSPCEVTFDCSTQEGGIGMRGSLPKTIPAMSTRTFTAADIEKYIGGSWSGKGRLGCALLSNGNIGSQVWTRSGNGVLVNNSALIRSIPDEKGIHRADIESIPSPDSTDESNIRLRCSSPISDCSDTNIRCYDDSGTKYTTSLRVIDRGATRHLQSRELSTMIGHRWTGLGLSCEISSAAQFTIQVLTRTGGGGALVNNSQSGIDR